AVHVRRPAGGGHRQPDGLQLRRQQPQAADRPVVPALAVRPAVPPRRRPGRDARTPDPVRAPTGLRGPQPPPLAPAPHAPHPPRPGPRAPPDTPQGFTPDPKVGYLNVLQNLQQVENDRRTIAAFEPIRQIFKELAKGPASGLSQLQVDQVERQLQQTRTAL